MRGDEELIDTSPLSTGSAAIASSPLASSPIAGSSTAGHPLESAANSLNVRLATDGGGRSESSNSHDVAAEIIKSSAWTGKRPLQEQVRAIQMFAPLAIRAADELGSAITQARINDPVATEALQVLKELHRSLGELLHLAEANQPMDAVWSTIERQKGRLVEILSGGLQVVAVAPVVAIGTGWVLGALSGETITAEMLTGLCAASMATDAAVRVTRERRDTK